MTYFPEIYAGSGLVLCLLAMFVLYRLRRD